MSGLQRYPDSRVRTPSVPSPSNLSTVASGGSPLTVARPSRHFTGFLSTNAPDDCAIRAPKPSAGPGERRVPSQLHER